MSLMLSCHNTNVANVSFNNHGIINTFCRRIFCLLLSQNTIKKHTFNIFSCMEMVERKKSKNTGEQNEKNVNVIIKSTADTQQMFSFSLRAETTDHRDTFLVSFLHFSYQMLISFFFHYHFRGAISLRVHFSV